MPDAAWPTDSWRRDELAALRSELANERTLLAYLRTALALVIAGTALLQVSQTTTQHLLSAVLIPGGLGFMGVGFWRARRTAARIAGLKARAAS